MASYFGYAKREQPPIDWSKITGEIIDRTYAIEEGREEKRQELDKIVADNDKIISSLEQGQNDTFNNFTMKGVDAGRDMIYDAYNRMRRGEISPSEYKRIQQSQMNQWGQFASATKSFNENVVKVQERSLEGKNSDLELANLEMAAKIASVDGMEMVWSDGKLLFANVDEDGKIIDKDNTVLASSFNTPGSLFVNKVDVGKAVKGYTDRWGEFKTVVNSLDVKTETGFSKHLDTKTKELFEDAITGAVDSIAGAPNQVGSILLDSMDKFTLTEDDASAPQYFVKRKPVSAGGALEPDFTDDGRYFMDNGNKVPIGPWQKEQAQKNVKDELLMGIGLSQEAKAVQTETSTTAGKKKEEAANIKTVELSRNLTLGDAATAETLKGREITNKGTLEEIQYQWDADGELIGIDFYIRPKGKDVKLRVESKSFVGKSAEERDRIVAPYVTKGTPSEIQAQFDKGLTLIEEGTLPTEKAKVRAKTVKLINRTTDKGEERFKEFGKSLEDGDVEKVFVPAVKKIIADKLKYLGGANVTYNINGDDVTFSIPGFDEKLKITGDLYTADDGEITAELTKIENFINNYSKHRAGGAKSKDTSKYNKKDE